MYLLQRNCSNNSNSSNNNNNNDDNNGNDDDDDNDNDNDKHGFCMVAYNIAEHGKLVCMHFTL